MDSICVHPRSTIIMSPEGFTFWTLSLYHNLCMKKIWLKFHTIQRLSNSSNGWCTNESFKVIRARQYWLVNRHCPTSNSNWLEIKRKVIYITGMNQSSFFQVTHSILDRQRCWVVFNSSQAISEDIRKLAQQYNKAAPQLQHVCVGDRTGESLMHR